MKCDGEDVVKGGVITETLVLRGLECGIGISGQIRR